MNRIPKGDPSSRGGQFAKGPHTDHGTAVVGDMKRLDLDGSWTPSDVTQFDDKPMDRDFAVVRRAGYQSQREFVTIRGDRDTFRAYVESGPNGPNIVVFVDEDGARRVDGRTHWADEYERGVIAENAMIDVDDETGAVVFVGGTNFEQTPVDDASNARDAYDFVADVREARERGLSDAEFFEDKGMEPVAFQPDGTLTEARVVERLWKRDDFRSWAEKKLRLDDWNDSDEDW